MQTFDSNGPNGRLRGNAYQLNEKYLALARDAHSSGDRIMAESFFQHAEHYYRILNANARPQDEEGNASGRPRGRNGADNAPSEEQAESAPTEESTASTT